MSKNIKNYKQMFDESNQIFPDLNQSFLILSDSELNEGQIKRKLFKFKLSSQHQKNFIHIF